jgi:hypothetical protein
MTDRELMQQSLEKLEFFAHMKSVSEDTTRLITRLRERLAQPLVSTDGTSTWIDIPQRPITPREMQPCAGRNCGSTNPNLHSAECFEDYEKSTGMNQWVGLTDQEINSVCYKRDWTAPWTNTTFARAIEEKLKEKNT